MLGKSSLNSASPGCGYRGRGDALPTGEALLSESAEGVELMRQALKKKLVRLPGEDWLISQFAAEVGAAVFMEGVYLRPDGEVVLLDGDTLRPLSPRTFRTWCETHITCYRPRQIKHSTFEVNLTMSEDTAAATLASPQFHQRLLKVKRLNRARLPVMREDGKVELLPVGYDYDSATLTLPGVEYAANMELAEAVETVNDLLSEFAFTDTRSKAVAVAGMVGLYAAQLLPPLSLRPCFITLKNAEGAGATLLCNAIIIPTLGEPATGCKADDDGEVRKLLLTAVREARPLLFLDNLKGHLSSEALEAFLSAPTWSDRKLGVNETITGENIATLFITGNGLTVSPDMRRRSLFCELHLDVERAEDRVFRRPLDVPTLLSMRPRILSALWSMVRHWDKAGRPAPSRSHSAFPSWANIIGGIVEAAGFGCPLETANVAAAADKDGDDMRSLVNAMAETGKAMDFGEVVEIARRLEVFEGLISGEGELDRKEKARFGRLLTRYDHRQVSNRRFLIEGKGHSRTYRVEPLHGQHGQHGQTHSYAKQSFSIPDGNTMQTMQPCNDKLPSETELPKYLKGMKA